MGNVKLIVNQIGRGSVASRDRMMQEARGSSCLQNPAASGKIES